MNSIDLMTQYLTEQHHLPTGWRIVRMECSPESCPEGFIKIEGAVCPCRPDGSVNWKKRDKTTDKSLWLERSRFEEWKDKFALGLGVCGHCWGDGKTIFRVSIKDSKEYRTCIACGGTGKPVAKGAA